MADENKQVTEDEETEIKEVQQEQEKLVEEEIKEAAEESDATVDAEDPIMQVQELTENMMRLAAEYDNYRKRTGKEKTEMYNNAKAQTVTEFLAVLDNLERALAAEEEENSLRQGLQMVVEQFYGVLEKLNVKEIPALNEKFNPDLHNAVKQVEDENFEENTICEVYEKGYQLNDKILRHAIVVVANP